MRNAEDSYMIKILMTGTVSTAPRELLAGRFIPKVKVRIDVMDALGSVQWVDCYSRDRKMRAHLLTLKVGDQVVIKGHPSWTYYIPSGRDVQSLRAQVLVTNVNRVQHGEISNLSKEAA
jgi:hypothetical protein